MRLPDIEDVLGTAALIAIFVMMIVAVFARYVLNDSIGWSEEFARLGLVAITFIGIGIGFKRHRHVRIDLSAIVGERLARIMFWVATTATLIFLLALTYNGIMLAQAMRASRTAALQLPLSWVYWMVGIAALVGVLRVIQISIGEIRKGR